MVEHVEQMEEEVVQESAAKSEDEEGEHLDGLNAQEMFNQYKSDDEDQQENNTFAENWILKIIKSGINDIISSQKH